MGLNQMFKALSDSTRRSILRLLIDGDLTAGEIGNEFDLSSATISHHLQVLKNAGLIVDEKKGTFVVYSLNTTVFQEVAGWVFDLTQNMLDKDSSKRRPDR